MDFSNENLWKAIADKEMVDIDLQKSIRKIPKPGDLFATKVAGHGWIPIQVMQSEPSLGTDTSLTLGDDECFLVYIYNAVSSSPCFVDAAIHPSNLFAPPLILSRELWTCKYLIFVKNIELDESSFIEQHCFWDLGQHACHDTFGRELETMTWPCASSAVTLRNGFAKILHKSLRTGFDQHTSPFD